MLEDIQITNTGHTQTITATTTVVSSDASEDADHRRVDPHKPLAGLTDTLAFWNAIVALVGALFFGLLKGVLIGSVVSMTIIIRHFVFAKIIPFGRVKGTPTTLWTYPGILQLRSSPELTSILLARDCFTLIARPIRNNSLG